MSNVIKTRVGDWDKDGTIVKVTNVTFDDGREVPGYDLPPGIEEGKPLPQGWEVATSAKGKPYIKVPKAGGGGRGAAPAAFRNTKEGQAVEQEAMNRRTALMQAVVVEPVMWQAIADEMFAWLSGSPVHSGQPVAHTRPTSSTAEVGMRGATGTVQESGDGEAPGSCASIADHAFVKGVCKKCGAPRP